MKPVPTDDPIVIDSQVHAYEPDHPGRPWRKHFVGPDHVTGDEMIAAMDAVGVDGAILVSPFTLYGYDSSYASKVQAAYPDRFALIKPVDVRDPAIEEIVDDWAAQNGSVGIRIIMPEISNEPDHPGVSRAIRAAIRHELPVNFFCWGQLGQVERYAALHPDAQIVIDHLGIPQPLQPPSPEAPFSDLPIVLKLANYGNISIKISGVFTLSQQEFPFRDAWVPIYRVLDAFGIDRCMWGTDWTRTALFLTYEEDMAAYRAMDRLTTSDRASLMGGSLAAIYRWSPRGHARKSTSPT